MTSFTPTHLRLLSGLLAVTVALTANLLATEAEIAGSRIDVADGGAADGYNVPLAPAPITGVSGPDLSDLPDLDDVEFVVPVLERPELRLPDPPTIEAAPWFGDGVMPAPTGAIHVEAPDVADAAWLETPTIDVPVLERPELPAPPPVR